MSSTIRGRPCSAGIVGMVRLNVRVLLLRKVVQREGRRLYRGLLLPWERGGMIRGRLLCWKGSGSEMFDSACLHIGNVLECCLLTTTKLVSHARNRAQQFRGNNNKLSSRVKTLPAPAWPKPKLNSPSPTLRIRLRGEY